jgi:hypothetical protein
MQVVSITSLSSSIASFICTRVIDVILWLTIEKNRYIHIEIKQACTERAKESSHQPQPA